MLVFSKSIPLLLSLSLSLYVCACTEEQLCETGGVSECSVGANGVTTYRICTYGIWAETKCASSQVCLVDGCIDPAMLCQVTQNTCLDVDTVKICVVGKRANEQACGDGKVCDLGACVDAVCNNHRLDAGELAVDCGGTCAACVACRSDADCGLGGFCDSAVGYVCSKRCRTGADCANNDLWDGEFCRGDGRCSPKVFETVWEVTAEDPSVVLPFDPDYANAKCDFQILWGDEAAGTDITGIARVTDCASIGNRTHTYAKSGKYNVKIIGTYDGWGAFSKLNMSSPEGIEILTTAAPKLRGILSFGPVGLSRGAFSAATMLNLMPVRDIPDASKLKNLNDFFYKALLFNAPIGHWDTSNVRDMSLMFWGAHIFNQPIGAWNTSRVTNMSSMFFEATAFNQPLFAWDMAQVVSTNGMFSKASAFNQGIDLWKLSSIENMAFMFEGASSFDQDLTDWRFSVAVVLEDIFKASGMSDANLCALKAVGGEWLSQSATLGKVAVCE